MPRITKVYTKKGDAGYTSLGGGQRVSKDSLRIEAYGTVDELNSHLGVVLAEGLDPESAQALEAVQNDLFHLGSDLCIREEDKETIQVPTVEERHVEALEGWIDEFNGQLEPLANFILPGGTAAAARLHVSRCIARRAERLVVGLSHQEAIGDHAVKYLNRLSDLLFVLARRANAVAGRDEVLWDSRR